MRGRERGGDRGGAGGRAAHGAPPPRRSARRPPRPRPLRVRWRRWWRGPGGVTFGEAEEEVLERGQLGGQREDRDAGTAERERELARVVLLGGELDPLRPRGGADALLRAQQRERATVVAGAQPVAGAALAAQVGERALVNDAAGVDDRDAIAQFLHLGELVGAEQHGHALVGQAPDERAHVAHAGRVQAGRGLVEDQQARAPQQRGGDPEPLAHAVRVAADLVLGARASSTDLEHLVDPRAGAVAVERGEQFEVLAAGQIGVEPGCLHEAGDPLERAGALSHRVAPEQLDLAGARRDQPERHPQGGRLAGPVGPEEAVHVPGADVQVDVVDREDFPVTLDQAPCRDGRRVDAGARGHAPGLRAAAGLTEPATR